MFTKLLMKCIILQLSLMLLNKSIWNDGFPFETGQANLFLKPDNNKANHLRGFERITSYCILSVFYLKEPNPYEQQTLQTREG